MLFLTEVHLLLMLHEKAASNFVYMSLKHMSVENVKRYFLLSVWIVVFPSTLLGFHFGAKLLAFHGNTPSAISFTLSCQKLITCIMEKLINMDDRIINISYSNDSTWQGGEIA